MNRTVVFGNSGAGKSTWARQLVDRTGCGHLDLDTIAWDPDAPTPQRLPLAVSRARIEAFLAEHSAWVVEGCYTDLLEIAAARATEMVFLNPGVAVCQANARARPWEPHKYATPEAQDANLPMLLEWIAAYETRDDEFSLAAHRRLCDGFAGSKVEWTSNDWRDSAGR